MFNLVYNNQLYKSTFWIFLSHLPLQTEKLEFDNYNFTKILILILFSIHQLASRPVNEHTTIGINTSIDFSKCFFSHSEVPLNGYTDKSLLWSPNHYKEGTWWSLSGKIGAGFVGGKILNKWAWELSRWRGCETLAIFCVAKSKWLGGKRNIFLLCRYYCYVYIFRVNTSKPQRDEK